MLYTFIIVVILILCYLVLSYEPILYILMPLLISLYYIQGYSELNRSEPAYDPGFQFSDAATQDFFVACSFSLILLRNIYDCYVMIVLFYS